ncbi:sensor histidine kinase [Balneola sp. MJW-20]|uniref:sensor histidine kinase n=1 Tax=Gracilimonas aurantiaca TaxID=3234185 RepID=UPI0034669630
MRSNITSFSTTYQDYVRHPLVTITIGLTAVSGYIADALLFSFSNVILLNYTCAAASLLITFFYLLKWRDPWQTLGSLCIIFGLNLIAAPYLELEVLNFSSFYFRNSLFYWVLIPLTGLIWNSRISLISAFIFLIQYLSILFLTGDEYLYESFFTVIFVLAIYTFAIYSIIESIKSSLQYQRELIGILESKSTELDELVASRNKMLSIISHDLRTPMMSLNTLSFLIRDELKEIPSNELKENFDIMDQTIRSTNDLINNLLEWSRNRNQTSDISPENLDVIHTIKSVTDLLSSAAKQKNIQLKIGPLDNNTIYADSNSLHTILRNLIANALKFTEEGGLIRVYSENAPSESLLVVEDNGMGMDEQKISELTDPANFKSSRGTENERGTGLGFNLCMDLMNLHHGKILVESEKGVGTKVTLCFPDPVPGTPGN